MSEADDLRPDDQVDDATAAGGGAPGAPDDGPAPLTADQLAEVSAANKRAVDILKAGRVASFNGWTIGTFGVISVLFGLGSLTALVVGVGLLVVAWNEFRGRNLLRGFELKGPRLLGRNQIGLMALIIAYCLWSIHHTIHHPSESIRQLEMVVGAGGTVTQLVVWGYAAVIVLSILAQGLNARYYFRRIDQLQAYLRDTPGWVVELQRATSGLRE
jgi:hypothetical protein